MRKIVVVGGGASGLAAALAAARAGASVTVVERLDRVGKKILSTGNGRCNLGNMDISPARYHSGNPELLAELLAEMPPERTTDFFREIGLLCRTEDSGRIYPATNQAATVLDVLLLALSRSGVQLRCGERVTGIRAAGKGFEVCTETGVLKADKVILAAGGRAAKKLGTDGDAYPLAGAFGHSCRPVYPCLAALRCKGTELPGLKGIRVQGTARLYAGKALLGESAGEIQLTDYGISGIPAMELSCVMQGEKAEIRLDLFPEWSFGELRALLAERVRRQGSEPVENLLTGLLNKKIGFALLKRCGVSPLSRPIGTLKREELDELTRLCKAWNFPVLEVLGWDKAQCTGGGVPLTEVEPHTFQSRKQRGLYLTGEELDVVGNCGGFNLHWAWCTGLAAGKAAAE